MEDSEVPKTEIDIVGFENHILEAVRLIKDKNSKGAIALLGDGSKIEKVGFDFDDSIVVPLFKTPDDSMIQGLADVAASRSMAFNIMKSPNLVQIATVAAMNEGVVIPDELRYEVALIHAEEWLHVLQRLRGRPIAGYNNPELDVAAWLQEQGVPLTDIFLKRYRRKRLLAEKKDEPLDQWIIDAQNQKPRRKRLFGKKR